MKFSGDNMRTLACHEVETVSGGELGSFDIVMISGAAGSLLGIGNAFATPVTSIFELAGLVATNSFLYGAVGVMVGTPVAILYSYVDKVTTKDKQA